LLTPQWLIWLYFVYRMFEIFMCSSLQYKLLTCLSSLWNVLHMCKYIIYYTHLYPYVMYRVMDELLLVRLIFFLKCLLPKIVLECYFLLVSGFMIWEDVQIHGSKFKFILSYIQILMYIIIIWLKLLILDAWILKSLKDHVGFWVGTSHSCTGHWHEFRTMITKSLEIKTMVEIKIMHEIWIPEIKNWMF
jgi:hypothetical protein